MFRYGNGRRAGSVKVFFILYPVIQVQGHMNFRCSLVNGKAGLVATAYRIPVAGCIVLTISYSRVGMTYIIGAL